MQLKIAHKKIGDNQPVFIVAELGINHNGKLSLAKKMINAAQQAGADAVKLQSFVVDDFVGDKKLTYTYESQGKKVTETQYKKRVVLPFSGSKEKMRHVLEHELTHSFQVETLKKQVYNVPLWFIEGMAEHNSKSWDAEADLILRDANLNGFLPSLERNSFAYGFLLYKYGEFASAAATAHKGSAKR